MSTPLVAQLVEAAETSVDDDNRIINSGLGNSNQIIPLPSTMATASIDLGGAEIVSYAADHKVALVITGGDQLAVVNLSNPSSPKLVKSYTLDGDAQSVTVNGDLAAVAIAGKYLRNAYADLSTVPAQISRHRAFQMTLPPLAKGAVVHPIQKI